MSTLQEIISEIKTIAENSGFTKVFEKKINLTDISDSELPIMFIKLASLEYAKFRMDAVEETYTLELSIIIDKSDNPISDLKSRQDSFLSNFVKSELLKPYFYKEKINLISTSMTNDKEVTKDLNGESTVLTITIENVINF